MCVCKCCFWCLEKFMKFLNRNAYIMCAVSGKNFCTSAKEAFFLLLRNAARLAVLTGVVNFLMFLSKIVVVGLCAALSYLVFSGQLQVVLKINSRLIFKSHSIMDMGIKYRWKLRTYRYKRALHWKVVRLGIYFIIRFAFRQCQCTVKQQGAFYEILFIYLNSSIDNIAVHDSARKEQIHICLVVCNFLSRPI